jgi:microcompartment protein CcmL/EutN
MTDSSPALALLEFDSIAAGIFAADAMAKKAPIDLLRAGTVQPGKYLVLIAGEVAAVEESLLAGQAVGGLAILDQVFLPHAHIGIVTALRGARDVQRLPRREDQMGLAIGVIETLTVAAVIRAADAGLKGAEVDLVELRLADGLGGKGLAVFTGRVADVEVAVEIGAGVLADPKVVVRQIVVPQIHADLAANLITGSRFRELSGPRLIGSDGGERT